MEQSLNVNIAELVVKEMITLKNLKITVSFKCDPAAAAACLEVSNKALDMLIKATTLG
jgi:hypothetical protein